jgi:hypothetical protein
MTVLKADITTVRFRGREFGIAPAPPPPQPRIFVSFFCEDERDQAALEAFLRPSFEINATLSPDSDLSILHEMADETSDRVARAHAQAVEHACRMFVGRGLATVQTVATFITNLRNDRDELLAQVVGRPRGGGLSFEIQALPQMPWGSVHDRRIE